ncbi:beta-phosphoglucomutase [Paucilactobacillus sp. N302-9]
MTDFNEIKGFLFDLDGVITDTARFHAQAWHQLATTLGVQWTPSLANGLKGISRMDSLEMILKAGHIESNYSEAEKQQLATQKNELYLQLIETVTPNDTFPGIVAFLDELQKNGYQMAIASASKNAPLVLKKLALTNYFPQIVDPQTLHKGKPDPEIFLKAAQLLKLQPSQCVGLEDAVAGIDSINGAGEVSIGIGSAQVLTKAHMTFSDTKNLTLANIQKNW